MPSASASSAGLSSGSPRAVRSGIGLICLQSVDTLVELVRSCGFDIPLELEPYDPEPDERVAEIQMLSPERRVDRLLEKREREGT